MERFFDVVHVEVNIRGKLDSTRLMDRSYWPVGAQGSDEPDDTDNFDSLFGAVDKLLQPWDR